MASSKDRSNPLALTKIGRAQSTMNDWLTYYDASWSIPTERIDDEIEELKDIGILDENRNFRSSMLQRYLSKLGELSEPNPFRAPVEREALYSLAVHQIALPDELQPIKFQAIGAGGQAKVFAGEFAGRLSAIRITELANENERREFVKACSALYALLGSKTVLPGRLHLPVVRKAGLIKDGASRGVVIYDYISGHDLSESIGTLPDAAVVLIGHALSEVLVLLERRKVLHCDIRPQNIILDSTLCPFLVDFGLARLVESDSNVAPIAHTEFVAPEIQLSKKSWSHMADLYSLATTLQVLRKNRDMSTPLGRVLGGALDFDPTSRTRPAELESQLSALLLDMKIEEKRSLHRTKIESLLAQTNVTELVKKACNYHIEHIVATALGVLNVLSSAMQAAQLLDDLFGLWQSNIGLSGKALHLARLNPSDVQNLPLALRQQVGAVLAVETRVVGYLRHANAHRDGHSANLDEALSLLGLSTSSPQLTGELWQALLVTAERMERTWGLSGASEVIEKWFDLL